MALLDPTEPGKPEDIRAPAPAAPVTHRGFLDHDTARKNIFDGVLDAVKTGFPVENTRYRLELVDPTYEGPDKFSKADEKKAILSRGSLSRKLVGTWRLSDKNTGEVLDERRQALANIPYLTSRGVYINNGSEYTVSHQMRLLSGVFTRQKESGEFEAHFNVLRGGPSFRVFMEPQTGVFRLQLGQSKIRLFPILKSLGVTDRQLMDRWGNEVYQANAGGRETGTEVKKVLAKLGTFGTKEELGEAPPKSVAELFSNLELDPRVTSRTLGKPHARVTSDVFLDTTGKLLGISKGEQEQDDRDSLSYQDTYSAEDLFKERFQRDAGNLVRRALQKASLNRNLKHFHPGMLNAHVDSVLYKSGMGSALEEINPIDILDQNSKVTRMGEGGIPGGESVPMEARSVQPSHFMFIDPVKTPESGNVGVDARIAAGAMKGSDRKMYSPFIDVRSGKTAMLSADALADKVVAFPGERRRAVAEGRPVIKAMHRGQTIFVNPKEVDYEASSPTDMFTHTSNLVPLFSAMKGQRLSMGARMLSQAMCLEDPEAQLVQSADPSGRSLAAAAGAHMGAVFSKEGGTVVSVSPDEVKVRTPSGAVETHELYNNLPFNRKAYLHNTPMVKPGQQIGPGGLVARSNFTDARGTMALGKNLRVAYLPYRGKTRYTDATNGAGDEYEMGANYEDAVIISESAAKKMTSEKMYTHSLESTRFASPSKPKFISMYPSNFNSKQLETIDDNGVVRPGTRVEYGDPLILAVEQRTSKGAGMLHRGGKSAYNDASVVWTHHFPGVVTDVYSDDEGTKIATKGMAPSEVGDKLAGLYGNKGVISAIVPDEQMLHGEDGKPVDLVFNPLGVISRVNPAQAYEALLGKIAKRTNKPYVVPSFKDGAELAEFVQRELLLHGEKDLEVARDPVKNRNIPNVITGHSYILKLHHTAESKQSERGLGAYTIEGEPARGLDQGSSNPKRIGEGEMKALLAHGAPNTISDIKLVRGQRNEDYWRAVIQGRPPPAPGVPNAYRKFLTLLQGAGINLHARGDGVQLLAMTDKDVDRLSAGEIKSPDTVRWHASFGRGAFNEKSMDPIDGGLFDRGITGGHGGNRWSHVTLDEPLPSPVMEEPIRRLLGLTQKEFEETIAGRHSLGSYGSGAAGIKAALAAINIPREIETQKQVAFNKRGTARDLAIKKMKYLTALKDTQVNPADLVVSKVPVIPPVFRPITSTDKFDMVANPNLLYRSLLQANSNFKQIKSVLEGDHVGDARLNLYRAFKAVTGLGDPVSRELVQQNVGGLLSAIKGDSPKNSLLQRKLIGTSVDVAGRAVITPNPSLNIDQIGIPENMAWEIYSPFVINRLVREMGGLQNVPAVVRMIEDKAPRAREALLREMKERPVKASRAPVLHKYGIMAFEPVLVKSKTIQLSPPVTPPFGADFDGDTMNIHVTISPQAIREAREKMMPSRNLRSPADFTPLWGLRQEFLDGLYRASAAKSDKPPRLFRSRADVLAAFNRGELGLDDNIVIAGT